jgi:putative membrane protein
MQRAITMVVTLTLGMALGAFGQAVLSPADKAFINQAGVGGTEELQLSMLVPKYSSDPDVKRFARRMLDDHSAAAAELKAIVGHKNVSPPDDIMDPEHTMLKSQLQDAGAAFDPMYMAAMVKDHQQTITLFQAEAANGGDPDIKAFAARQIATIQQHLAEAQRIASRYVAPKR